MYLLLVNTLKLDFFFFFLISTPLKKGLFKMRPHPALDRNSGDGSLSPDHA